MVLIWCIAFTAGPVSGQTGLEIMQKYQDATRTESLRSVIVYENKSKKGRVQEREMEQFILKNDLGENTYNLLLRFNAPADVAGTATLTIQQDGSEDEQWLYLPALGNARRISPSKKTNRFMGTEMTYEDLSNYLSEPLEKYAYTYTGDEMIDGKACFRVTAEPSDPELVRNSGYKFREMWIDQGTLQNVKTVFYDKKGEPLKEYHAYAFQQVEGAELLKPGRIVMRNLQTGNLTEVRYFDMQSTGDMSKDLFTRASLESE